MNTAAHWRKSSPSGGVGNNCVEIADLHGRIAIRDSKAPGDGRLVLSRKGFAALLQRIA